MALPLFLLGKLTYSPIVIGVLIIVFILTDVFEHFIAEYFNNKHKKFWDRIAARERAKVFDANLALRRKQTAPKNGLVPPSTIADIAEIENDEEILELAGWIWVISDENGTYEVLNYEKLSDKEKAKCKKVLKRELDYQEANSVTHS